LRLTKEVYRRFTMNIETKGPILGKLRDQLQDFLMKNHPFLMEIPLEMGRDSVDTFETDILSAFARSESFLMNDPTISAIVTQALKVIGMDASIEVAVEYAARRLSTQGELPKKNPVAVGLFYDYVVLPILRVQQLMTRNIICIHPGLLPYEKAIMREGVEIARLFDVLFSKWWKYVVIPYQLGIAKDPTLKETIKAACSFTNCYAVLWDQEGFPIVDPMTREILANCQEIPLAKAFPLEIDEICERLEDLKAELEQWSVETMTPYHDYFNALSIALSNRELEKMEELWKAVDVTWVQIGPERVVPVHMMENGYHHPHQISPEFDIRLRSQAFRKEIDATRHGMNLLGANIEDELVQDKLTRTDIGMFITVASGGMGIDFRFAGQSVPNRPEVQKLAMKIFLDLESMRQRQIRCLGMIESCADAETIAWASRAMTLSVDIGAVAGHEFAHPFLITEMVTEVFGSQKPRFEEGKATLLGIMGLHEAKSDFGPGFYPALSAHILGVILRRFDKRAAENPTFSPYLNEAMMIATSLMRAGIITCIDGKVHMDQARSLTPDVVNNLQNVSLQLIRAYREANDEFKLTPEDIHPALTSALKVVTEFAPGIEEDPNLRLLFSTVNHNMYGG